MGLHLISQFVIVLAVFLTLEQFVESVPQFLVTRFEDEPVIDEVTGTPYKNCGGSASELKQVELIPCDVDSGHCVLERGTNVTFKMSFLSEEDSKTLKLKIYGIIDYFPVPFPSPQPNGCKDSGIECPVTKGHLYNYTLSAPVLPKYPKASLWIKGELKDDAGRPLVCIEVPVKIQ